MLASGHSPQEAESGDATDVVDATAPLTPSRDAAIHSGGGDYEEIGTPMPRMISMRRNQSGASAPIHHLRASHSRMLTENEDAAKKTPSSIALWHFVADAIFAVCLLVAVLTRVNIISIVYLLVFCYGVIQSFESAIITVFTMVFSIGVCIAHVVLSAVFLSRDNWSGTSIARTIGFERLDNARTIASHVGVDALVVVCSAVHYFYVLRRIRRFKQQTFDFFQAGVFMLQQVTEQLTRTQDRAQYAEIVCAILLFITALSVPAGATAFFYLALLTRLLRWTVYTRRITVDQFVAHDIPRNYFLGKRTSQVLLAFSCVAIIAWYTLQLNDLRTNKTVRDVMRYAGFVDFRGGHVNWEYYVFASALFLLFVSLAKVVNLHRAVDKDSEVFQLSSPGSSPRDRKRNQSPDQRHYEEHVSTPETRGELQDMLQQQPFFTRIFLHDGGALMACAAAIVWSVSYPSYASTGMIALAFFILGIYGLFPSFPLIGPLIAYGTALAITEFVSNMTLGLVTDDYSKYGLEVFEFPFLDLSVHNLCLVVMYASIRTRWRYRDVLRAARDNNRSRGDDDTDPDNAVTNNPSSVRSPDPLRGLRQHQKLDTDWKNMFPMWVQDAKQVIFTHLDALVLVTIIAVALSAQVSLIQTGYLVIAVVLILFFERRRKLWRGLLLYALAACLAVFVRNIDCTPDKELDLVGLTCYDAAASTWASLWPTLFSAQLAIIFQVVFQLVVYVSNKRTIDERLRTMNLSHQNPVFFVSRIAVEIDNCFRIVGCLVCYIAMLVVAFQFEIDSTRTHTTVVGGIQLILLFSVLGGHLGKFKSAPRTSLRLKVLWFLVLVTEVLILVARYVFQFDDVSSYLEKHVFTANFVSAKDFGLENRSRDGKLSGVFFYLLPTAVVMALTFWQLASLTREIRSYDLLVAGRSRTIDRLLFGFETVRQLLITFSNTSLIIVTMSVAISKTDAVGALYVLILVIGRPLSSWRKLWFPLFWVSGLATIAVYMYQLRLFAPDDNEDGTRRVNIRKDAKWAGLDLMLRDDNTKVSMWKLSSGPLLIVLMSFIQRLSQFFEEEDATHKPIRVDQHMPSPVAMPDGGADTAEASSSVPIISKDLSGTPSNVSGDQVIHDPTLFAPLRYGTFGSGRELHYEEDETDFWTCLRAFCIEYASHASVNVVMLLLMAAAFAHRDVIAVFYMLVVYSMMYADPNNVCRVWFLIAFALSFVILVEYGLLVWLPPFVGKVKAKTEPWELLSADEQRWLGLGEQHKWALLADFVALLTTYMLPQSRRLQRSGADGENVVEIAVHEAPNLETVAKTPLADAVADRRVSLAAPVSSMMSLEASNSRVDPTDEPIAQDSPYIIQTRKFIWYALEYVVVMAWLPVTLIVVFACGSDNGGIASFVYVAAAVYLLYHLDDARDPANEWVQRLRQWNWLHLFLMIVTFAPRVDEELTKCRSGNGSVEDPCLSIASLLGIVTTSTPSGVIAVFVLISIHCEMATTRAYRHVYQHLQNETRRATWRRKVMIRGWVRERTELWYSLKKEKSAALQRLKLIVSKLVHKVEELMDIAMGLHYNLPPMAPSQPRVIECSQNAITLEWDPPQDSVHRIRYYRITRQQYPSMTLLGDFADMVEVNGSISRVTIEGLRPGASYQFKVAAVSRMGEGPFSIASDPATTQPLNLDGSCIAAWMKFRREHLKNTWMSRWLAFFRPKFLHRFVVMDSKALVFYKDEEAALRHRSKRRRRKIKTRFTWQNVMTLRLSESKVQFDDVSPLLYCFELIVRHEEDKPDGKYIFQVDASKDFDRFLSWLAFSVPVHVIDESIIACMRDRNLQTPLDVAPSGDNVGAAEGDVGDDNGSELSSVTGDESSFGDPEADEFAEPSNAWLSWRLPLYRFFYGLQDPVLKAETTQYDPDDQCEPTVLEIVRVIVNAVRSRSAEVCYATLVFCFACQADLLNLVFVLVTFGYLAVENPRPSSRMWMYLLKYTCFVVVIRYTFQLSVFCQGLTGGGYFYPSIHPYCGAPSGSVVLREKPVQPVVLLGIYKFDGSVLTSMKSIVDGLKWNFVVALAILWHRRELLARGLWVEPRGNAGQRSGNTNFSIAESQRYRSSLMSSRDSIDDTFNFGGMPRRVAEASGVARDEEVTPTIEPAQVGGIDPDADSSGFEEENMVAEEVLAELQQEDSVPRHNSNATTASEGQGEAAELAQETDEAHRSLSVQNVEIEDDTDGQRLELHRKGRLETTFPRIAAYYDTVACKPPAHWEKDIHAAISGAKPGRDYYAMSLFMLLIASIYAVIFFKQLGDPEPDSSGGDGVTARVVTTSMVSGYLVLLVFIDLCFIIWDRAAYVCGSIVSKLVLQYVYTLVLHVCIWLVLPGHINTYFHLRPALVVFYLLHCIYLWLGALQIRHGYPVFRGSQYNYTTQNVYTKIYESTFGLVMMAPFLFEMRALLDYVCTKTSLSWPHWVMLEETAAHLFQVKLEMRGRVEDGEVLQGKKRQPFHAKFFGAGIMLLGLLLCLIGPLALFSSANPSTKANRVIQTEVVLGIEDTRGTVNRLYSGIDIKSPDYEGKQIAEGAIVQRITYDAFSRDVWATSPPNIDRLIGQLKSTEPLAWILTLTFERPGPTDNQKISSTYRVNISSDDRLSLISMIQLNSTDKSEMVSTPIKVGGILPPLVQLTATDGVLRRSKVLRAVNVTKHSISGTSWWSVTPLLRNGVEDSKANDSDPEYCDSESPFCLIAISDNIVQGLNTIGIGSYGITAVYFFVLVTIGSAVKGFFRGALFQVQYSELPDPDDVLELIEGIYIARAERYVGHLKDEVRIFETLVRVLRSPETLSKVTGTNVIHIPKAKEKIE
ncbi:hypothetical protein PINS_up015038 [Pythium insidiosum]|nr:hypothetical protein PINS_up015038 [Pythium insidiosum]